jgi:hypothetical protein
MRTYNVISLNLRVQQIPSAKYAAQCSIAIVYGQKEGIAIFLYGRY